MSENRDQLVIMKQKVLFICVHNSARSQMAEAFLNLICPDYFEAQSAGLEPGAVRIELIAAYLVEKRFRYLAAGAVVNTNE